MNVTAPTRRIRCWSSLVMIAALAAVDAWSAPLSGQDPAGETSDAPRADEKQQFERWQAYYADQAARLELWLGEDDPQRLQLRAEPIHVYSNPAGGTQTHGALFVWTAEQRPEVIGAIWSRKLGDLRRVSQSLHATALAPLRGMRNGATFWSPTQSAFTRSAWSAAGRPGGSSRQRLIQMRGIARSLKFVRMYRGDSTMLRVLPQPLYRYESSEVIDGAVFGVFFDWDPELFVIVEALPGEAGAEWHVGFARFSNKQLRATYNGQDVWSYDPQGDEPPYGGREFAYVSEPIEVRPDIIDEAP